tara:strand:- start:3343 stop:4116 length:774 start_codon:yes stop_codon:yes gene_type:complete
MSRITLTNLRSAIYSYLDDDGTRWTAGSSANSLDLSTDLDRAIKYAMQQAVRFYTRNGGEGILIQKTFVTDSNGQVSLGADDKNMALFISNVSIRDANAWGSATATRADEVEYRDTAPRQIRVNFIPEPYVVVDVDPGPPIVIGPKDGMIAFCSDASLDIPELEILATLYAVRNLLPKDAEQNLAINDAIFQGENSISGILDTPFAVEFPHYGRAPSTYMRYRWAFLRYDPDSALPDPKINIIQIHRPLYSFYDIVT